MAEAGLESRWISSRVKGSVLGSTLEASRFTGPSEDKQQGRVWTHRHHREMYGCILPSKPPARQGRRFTVLYPGIQLEQAGLQQAEQVNQLHIFWNGLFLSQINTVSPSNNLMRGREGNGKVEYAVCTKVTLTMVAESRQYTRANDTQPLVLGGGGGDRKQPKNSICLCHTLKRTKTLAFKNYF